MQRELDPQERAWAEVRKKTRNEQRARGYFDNMKKIKRGETCTARSYVIREWTKNEEKKEIREWRRRNKKVVKKNLGS